MRAWALRDRVGPYLDLSTLLSSFAACVVKEVAGFVFELSEFWI